jgi:poly-beta-1,6-N-acetyl-D-glucosamine N-deacetylase
LGELVILRVLLRLGVTVTTLVALAVPTLTFVYVRDRVQVGAQVSDLPTPPALTPQQSDRYASYGRGAATGMVVLGYHDVVKNETPAVAGAGRRVSVSAVNLAAQLRMLRLAGFESVSAADVARYVLGGAPPPRRSVMITFDGARVRDWTYADRILRDYGFRATVFVDPTIVDVATRGTTLSWAQLRALVGTGRWSVGVLPSVLAEPVAVDAGGRRESGIVAHRWLPDQHRPETTEEFTARVHDALTRSRQKIVDQGLPSPVLLSYPFQAGYPLDRVSPVFGELSTAVQALFSASVLTSATDEVSGTQWTGRRLLPRIEVYGASTDEVLFARIADGLGR